MPNPEPSVLDYLKSRLKFWKRPEEGILPFESPEPRKKLASPAGKTPAATTETKVRTAGRKRGAVAVAEEAPPAKPLPWRSLLALAFALAGQFAFEQRAGRPGIILYLVSAVFLILAILRKEWTPAPLPAVEEGDESFTVRLMPLVLAIILGFAAFLTLGGNLFSMDDLTILGVTLHANLFTPLNVILWVLATSCLVWAFWRSNPGGGVPLGKRIQAFFSRESWPIVITRWGVLVLLVTGLVVFYRTYRLTSVPSVPFSDHAEKLLDVYDVTHGQPHIFFPRNTGREAIQMYETVVVAWLFHTGLTFLSLKIDTVIAGLLVLPFLYLLGKELGGKRIGLLTVLLAGIAYWPNVIGRVGLRFDLYPLFLAPMLYYLLRGLRKRRRNDFILSGIFLGLGLHGYTSYRIVPFVVVIAIGLFLLHAQARAQSRKVFFWLVIVTLVSLFIFLPLARYWLENPTMFSFRAFSRLGIGGTLPGSWWQILLSNIWNSLRMVNWDNGSIWVHSVPGRPALDIVSAALFLIGVVLVFARYVRERHWLDLFLLLSIPLLQLPSSLSLAFPGENPSLNRPSGALVPIFLIVAIALDGLLTSLASSLRARRGVAVMWVVVIVLVGWSSVQNYKLVFTDYVTKYNQLTWNSNEMAKVIEQFGYVYGSTDNAWIVPYPYWVDTRLPAIYIGEPSRDMVLWPKDFASTQQIKGAKEIIINPKDTQDLAALQQLYPRGVVSTFHSALENADKDFLIFFIPPAE